MSRTYDIACTQCKKALWIGQVGGSNERGYIYSGEPRTMAALNEFLWDHAGHPLIFTMGENLEDYEEVEPNAQVQREPRSGDPLQPHVGPNGETK